MSKAKVPLLRPLTFCRELGASDRLVYRRRCLSRGESEPFTRCVSS